MKMICHIVMIFFATARRSLLVLVLFLAFNFHYAFGQTPDLQTTPLDSLVSWIIPQLQVSELDSFSYQVAHQLLNRAKKEKDSTAIADLHYCLAEWHNFHYDFFSEPNDSAIYYDKIAIKYYRELDSINLLIKQYYYLSLDLGNLMRNKEAESAAFEGIRLADSINDQESIAKNYINLCNIYLDANDTLKAIEYGEKATKLLAQLKDDYYTELSYGSLASAYILGKQYEKAVEAATISIETITNSPENKPSYDHIHALQYRGDAYFYLEDYEKALKDYDRSLLVSNQYLEGVMNPLAYTSIGRVYRAQGKFEAALVQFKKAEEYMRKYGDEVGYFNEEMALVQEKMGNHRVALQYQRLDSRDKMDVLKTKIQSLESELLAKYESQQKDKTILLQQSAIQQKTKIQWLSFGVLGLLVSILGILFWFYRNDRRKKLQLLNLNQELGTINAQLDQRNAQNEILLKEIHHRVKNNLQTISSLLSLQSVYIENPEVLGAVAQSQNRVQSMALIHQKLYQGENLAAVEMKDYLQTLSESIIDSYGIDTNQITIEFPMEEVVMDVDNAIPIGLIANELITNAFKYAFPKNRKGTVEISLRKKGEANYSFSVKDDGVGTDKESMNKNSGFGSQLVQLLVQQINGQLHVNSKNGLATEVQFVLSVLLLICQCHFIF